MTSAREEGRPIEGKELESMSAKDWMIGGNHYSKLKIQPIDYITENELNWFQGNIIKYATRYPHKGCAADDLRKIKHYADLALQMLEDA